MRSQVELFKQGKVSGDITAIESERINSGFSSLDPLALREGAGGGAGAQPNVP